MAQRRITEFKHIMSNAAERFDTKNNEKEDAFMELNETLKDAFECLSATYDTVNRDIKMSDLAFDKEKTKKRLTDLIIYSALMIMWINERR